MITKLSGWFCNNCRFMWTFDEPSKCPDCGSYEIIKLKDANPEDIEGRGNARIRNRRKKK